MPVKKILTLITLSAGSRGPLAPIIMKKILTIIIFFSLFENFAFSQEKQDIRVIIFETISNRKPVGAKKLSNEYEVFINKLSESVAKKDANLLLTLVADDVEISAGGGVRGKDNFIEVFLKSKEEDAWLFLKNVLSMGGIIEPYEKSERIIFPYQRSSLFFEGIKDIDTIACAPYCIYYGISKTISILKEPNEKAKVVANLEYPILAKYYDEIDKNEKFDHVRTYDGKFSGWIQKNKVYCDAGRIIHIGKVGNKLKIITITPYD